MSYLPELRTALVRVAGERATPPAPRWHGIRSRARRALPALAVAAAVGVALGVVALAFSLRGPAHNGSRVQASSGAPDPRDAGYINAALNSVRRRDPACDPLPLVTNHVVRSHAAPSAALLSILGVLRRPPTPADQLPHSRPLENVASVVYVDYIRLAQVAYGTRWYLVPVEMPGRAIPARCLREELAALRRERPRIPPKLWTGTVQLELRRFHRLRHSAYAHPYQSLFVFGFAARSGFGGGGGVISTLERGQDLGTEGPLLHGLVPDGVATVTVYYGRAHRLSAASARVINNLFIIRDGGHFGQEIVWRSASGQVIKRIWPPGVKPSRPGSAFCRQNPKAC
jgi:hypothetical protein